jgi:hypothetical protein
METVKHNVINMKFLKFQNLCRTVGRILKMVQKEPVLKLYNIMAISVSLYGSEYRNLVIKQQTISSETAEMHF